MDTEYLKKVGLYVLGALLSLGLVFYFGYHIWRSVTKEVETQPVTKADAERCIEMDGYIFRSEVPVYTSSGGSVIPSVSEGEMVNIGGSIANVYSQSAPDVVAHIAEIEDRISLLRSCLDGGTSSFGDSANIDGEIYAALSEIRRESGLGNAASAVALRPSLISSINRRGLLTGSAADINADITALESEKNSLMSSLGALLQNVSAPSSGYYYSDVDGYENVFRPESLGDLTFDEALTLLSTPPESVGAGCAGKMVTSSVWYTLCRAERKYVNTFPKGSECVAEFKSNEISLTMTVEQIIEGESEAVFVLSSRQVPQGFDFSRVQKIELVEAEYTGLRVPIGAVRIVNGETGVYILDGSTVRFRAISVIYRGDGICIVDPDPDGTKKKNEGENGDGASDDENEAENENKTPWLSLHDNLIVSGKGLYDGRVIGS